MAGKHRFRGFRDYDLMSPVIVAAGFALSYGLTRSNAQARDATLVQAAVLPLLALTGAWGIYRARTPAVIRLAFVLDQLGLMLCLVLGLIFTIGRSQGWLSGTAEDTIIAIDASLMLVVLAYWLGGKRRLILALEARRDDSAGLGPDAA